MVDSNRQSDRDHARPPSLHPTGANPFAVAFVLEQTLGHRAHSANLESVLAERSDIDPDLVKVSPDGPPAPWWIPRSRTWSMQASWQARVALRERARRQRPRAIFVHTQVASLLLGRLARETPTVISLDATPLNFDAEGGSYGHARESRLSEGLKHAINARALRSAAAIVTWSAQARRSVIDDYGVADDRVRVVHPGVDLSLFRPGLRGQGASRLRLLFVGGDFARKGGHDLIASLAGLEDLVEVDIVTGSTVELPAGLRARVHRGLRPRSAPLVELYRQADAFVMPTRGDCFPQVFAEAMACGLPVIGTRVGAVAEMVFDGHNGLLVDPQAPAQLRAAIERMAAEPAARAAMGRHSLALAADKHDARRNWNQVLDLLVACGPSPVSQTSGRMAYR